MEHCARLLAMLAITLLPAAGRSQNAATPPAPKPFAAGDPALSPYARPGRLVDIGGRKIDLRCEGKGGPTVVLMNGHGVMAMEWYKVQPKLAQRVRTCGYDKAGYGYSDPAPMAQTLPDAVNDLHTALVAARIAGPYVLVGHSLAGLEARLFAQQWPSEVAGMVLVDSSFANQRSVQASLPGFAAANRAMTAFKAIALDCIERMARPDFGPTSLHYRPCVPPPWPGSPVDLVAAWPKLFRPAMWAANVSLLDAIATPELDGADHIDLGDKPIVVLTAGRSDNGPGLTEFTQAFRKIMLERHEGFAHLSSHGIHIVVPDSGHFIPLERPDAVIDAVDRVLKVVR